MADPSFIPRDPTADLRTRRALNRLTGQRQNPNVFLAGPVANPAAPANFRALVAADITPALPLTTAGDLLTRTTGLARLPVGARGFTLIADPTASSGLSWKPGTYVLDSQFTAVSNQGVGVTTMMQFGVVAGQFNSAGDTIEVTAVFSFVGGGGVEQIQVLWGNQTLATIVPNGNAGAMRVSVFIQRVNANQQNCMVDFSGSVGAVGTIVSTGTQNMAIGLGIVFTAQAAGGTGKIFQNAMLTKFSTV